MKKQPIRRCVITLLLLLPPSVLAASPPKQVIEEGAEKVRSVLRQKSKKGSPEEKSQKENLKTVVDGFLDYRELSRRSLGPHWEGRSSKEQDEFTTLLRDLIEASYTSAIRNNVEFTMKYESEEISEEDNTAVVAAVASAKTSKGKSVSEDLVFHLFLKTSRWMIFDVEFGEVSLVRHYRGEFNRKIKKESYQALVAAMQKKLKEIREGKPAEKEWKLQ
jgi:phospholipid transport system substrate-binding protein